MNIFSNLIVAYYGWFAYYPGNKKGVYSDFVLRILFLFICHYLAILNYISFYIHFGLKFHFVLFTLSCSFFTYLFLKTYSFKRLSEQFLSKYENYEFKTSQKFIIGTVELLVYVTSIAHPCVSALIVSNGSSLFDSIINWCNK